MKLFVNKSLFVVSLLLVGNLFFSSCHKDKNDAGIDTNPLIASISSYYWNGDLEYSQSFQYDKQGRLIKRIEDGGFYSTMEYSDSTVILRDYEADELKSTSIAKLNDMGLCTSVSSKDNNVVKTYEYTNDGYCKSNIYEDDTIWHASSFTISEENYATEKYEYIRKNINSSALKEPGLLKNSFLPTNHENSFDPLKSLKSAQFNYTLITEFQFYKDKINTITDKNMGLSFMGKQNKNLIKLDIITSAASPELEETYDTDSVTYTYEYDHRGRITQQIKSDEWNNHYYVYTYVD